MKTRTFNWSSIPNLVVRGAGRWCHARVEMNAKAHWRSLHIQADAEGKNAPDVKDAIRAFKLQLAKDTFAVLQLTRSRNEHSTIEQLFAAYAKACSGRAIKTETVTTTKSRLAHVVRAVHGEFYNVEEARTSIFTRDLAEQFEHAKIAAVKKAAEDAELAGQAWSAEQLEQRIQSATNSAKSVLQQARAIFAESLLAGVHYRELVLPDLKPFLSYRVEGGTTIAAYVAPPVEVWQKIIADLPALKASSPAAWLAFQLGANSGLRRSSARNARWSWCTENTDGSAEMRIGRAKGNNSTVTFAPDVWAELKAARTSIDYIIPGTFETPATRQKYREAHPEATIPAELTRDEVIDELVAWLRGRGLTVDVVDKPFHLLRKIFGDTMRKAHGLDEAQKALGHSSNRLTHAVYSDHRSTKHVRVS